MSRSTSKGHGDSFLGRLAALSVLVSLGLPGQSSTPVLPLVQGEITTAPGGFPDRLMVKLVEPGRPAYKSPAAIDWSFEFRGIPEGTTSSSLSIFMATSSGRI